jgi:phi13 family phage major tail protein
MSPLSINAGEYKSTIGLDNLYIAEVTSDDASAYVAGTPERLAPAANAVHEPSVTNQIQWADDQPYDVLSAQGETKITLTITGLPAEMLAWITGATFDDTTGRVFDNANPALAPYFALMFRSQKSNGSYRYYCYLKGKFSPPKEESATKTDKPDPKSTQVEFVAIKTVYEFSLGGGLTDSVKRVWGDEDTDAFVATGWFVQVQTPETTSVSALALSSSVPTDPGTNIVVSADLSLTFNNALVSAAVHGVALYLVSDGSLVAGTIVLDTAKKVITINPTASLTAGVAYLLTYAVTDIYGQTLRGAVNLATAA